jgi:methionyl aminopeptidase
LVAFGHHRWPRIACGMAEQRLPQQKTQNKQQSFLHGWQHNLGEIKKRWHDDRRLFYNVVMLQKSIKIHDAPAFAAMRVAGQLAAEVLDYITPFVLPGVTTEKLDKLCHEYIVGHGAIPAPLNYRGFPKSICTSINHVVCHGIPGPKKLVEGDIINIDVTVIVDGWHGDTSRMYGVGTVGVKGRRLIDATYDAMMAGINLIRPGVTLGDIGYAIQQLAEGRQFSVVRDFCGHGIGQVFHDEPSVLHYGKRGEGMALKAGMFFTVEPMINAGGFTTKVLSDGWTAVTRDHSLSAQFEHTVGVTETGVEIFTTSPKGWHKPPYV